MDPSAITPGLLLRAYAAGIFPMAERHDDPHLHWIEPERRGIIPLERFHISRSLARRIRRAEYTVRINSDFAGVMRACAERSETWINEPILRLTQELHRRGYAHSLELHAAGRLVGGVYGVALGGAFFGESMFSRVTDASKVALAYLVDRLRAGGFVLFDTQFLTPHLARLGGVEISREAYRARLADALRREADFLRQPAPPSPQLLLQRNTQTS